MVGAPGADRVPVLFVYCIQISVLLHKNFDLFLRNNIKDSFLRIVIRWSAGGQVGMDDEAGCATMIATDGTKSCGVNAVQ